MIAFSSQLTISYPAGYVVSRVDCADISEDELSYEENNVEYAVYKKMKDFNENDLVEYFSGNIVVIFLMKKYHIQNTLSFV